MENFTGKFLWNSNLLEKITGGKSSGYWECDGIEIDSRKVKVGDLFLALSGQKLDGHNFVEASILAGASAVMIKNDYTKNYKKFQNITVTDVFQSLIHIAQEARMRAEKLYKTKFIAITGSSGKTSTKEMMKIVLGKIGNTYANPESFNNHVGVPYSLANISRNNKFGIFEIGMNRLDEVRDLSSLVRPQVAVITNISEAHVGNFNSIDEIIKAKSEIFYGLVKGGYAIINRDKISFEKIKFLANKTGITNLLTFGQTNKSDVHLKSRKLINGGQSLVANVFGKEHAYDINLYGFHQALNSLSVLAVMKVLGCDVEQGIKAFSSVKTTSGRGKKHKIYIKNKESVLIDDSYNANPSSVEASVRMLVEVAQKGRTVFIFGDMKELGRFSKELHERIASVINKLKIDLVFCIGEETKVIFKSSKKYCEVFWYRDVNDLNKSNFDDMLLPGDNILIKGSRVMQMEKIVKYLIKNCVKERK